MISKPVRTAVLGADDMTDCLATLIIIGSHYTLTSH